MKENMSKNFDIDLKYKSTIENEISKSLLLKEYLNPSIHIYYFSKLDWEEVNKAIEAANKLMVSK